MYMINISLLRGYRQGVIWHEPRRLPTANLGYGMHLDVNIFTDYDTIFTYYRQTYHIHRP